MDGISKALEAHYTARFLEHGPTPRGVDWNREADVHLRYEKMLAVADGTPADDAATWLDVGCGYGGLYEYAASRGRSLRYSGIDVSAPMIESGRSQFADASFRCSDVFDVPAGEAFDYVVCCGILTQKLTATNREMDVFAQRLIQAMFALCKRGVAFNVMTTKVNFTVPNLYYKSPLELLGYCMESVTPRVRLDHSYPLYEYTLYLYK